MTVYIIYTHVQKRRELAYCVRDLRAFVWSDTYYRSTAFTRFFDRRFSYRDSYRNFNSEIISHQKTSSEIDSRDF